MIARLQLSFLLPPLSPFLLLAAFLPSSILGQPAASSPRAPLTTIPAVRSLGPERAESGALPVKLRGVVTFVSSSRDSFKIHDGAAGIGVSLPETVPCPAVGDLVDVDGATKTVDVQNRRYPHIEGHSVSVAGTASLPAPIPVSVTNLASFAHYDQWVSVEGVVVMWTFKASALSVMITGPETWAVVHVQNFRAGDFPAGLHGARIRITGVNMGLSHSQSDTLIAPGPEHLEILKPGRRHIFDLPLTPMADVAARRVPLAERVRIRGVVTATTGRQIVCLRDGDSAVCVGLEHGWLRSSSKGHLYADGGSLPDLVPGDEVEVVGSRWTPTVDSRENGFSLHLGHVRIIGSQPAPEPIHASLAAIAGGALTHHLVQIRARLVHQDQFPAHRNQWRSTLILDAGGVRLPATLQSRSKIPFPDLKLNDELLVTGLVDPATASAVRQLWLVSPSDVVSLGLSPAVRRRQIWLWTGAVTLIAAVAAVWITTLHRSLRRQALAESTIKDLNQTLEKRVHDRTVELHQTQADLKRALEQERELGELKSRFVTMVSHEFRTPLGIIMSAIELMRHYGDRLPAAQKSELQEDIHSATRLMAGLMEQVLVLGRVEAGKLGYRPLPIDIDTLARKLSDEALSATSHRCPILWQPSGDLSGASADEALIRHIFSNLVTNAVKYSPEGSPVLLSARRDGTDIIFEVRDQGIGIPPEDLPQLFDAFFRCRNVGDIPGTGLGLVIVKRCVDLHGGSIQLASQPGAGTSFTVRLPAFAAPPQTSAAPAA